MNAIEKEFIQLVTVDGYKIATWISIPRRAKAVVVLCHGITVDSTEGGLFVNFEEKLLAQNLGAIRFDFRCHGKSDGTPRELTLYGEHLDLDIVTKYAKEKLDLPFILLATSFSCSAVVKKVSEGNLLCEGVVLWNPVVNYRDTFLEPSTPWVISILETCEDKDLPQWAYAKIPGTRYFITKELVKEFENDKTCQLLQKLAVPAIGFHGSKDIKIPYVFLEKVALKNQNLEFHLLKGEGHGFKGKRDYVIGETISWIERGIK